MTIKITVPGDPVAKGRPRFNRATGRSYTPAKTEHYENLIRLAYDLQCPDRKPAEGPITIYMKAYFSIPGSWSQKRQTAAAKREIHKISKPDLDNCLKAALDGLNKVAWRDDSQIDEIHMWKAYDERPRLEIMIETEEESDGNN